MTSRMKIYICKITIYIALIWTPWKVNILETKIKRTIQSPRIKIEVNLLTVINIPFTSKPAPNIPTQDTHTTITPVTIAKVETVYIKLVTSCPQTSRVLKAGKTSCEIFWVLSKAPATTKPTPNSCKRTTCYDLPNKHF